MKSAITDIEVVVKVEHYVTYTPKQIIGNYDIIKYIHPIQIAFMTINFNSFIISENGIIDNRFVNDDQCRQLLAWENIVKFELNTGGIWA